MIRNPVDRFVPLHTIADEGKPRVYQISSDYVLLFDARPNRESTQKYLREETERLKHDVAIQRRLHDADYNVPMSLGVTHFKLSAETWFAQKGDVVAAHLMRYVHGVSALELPQNTPQRHVALENYTRLIDIIGNDFALDLTPLNTGLQRVIIDPKGDICLYDFSGWKWGRN